MADLEKIVRLGKELGLEGTALEEFVRNERAEYSELMKEEEEMRHERMKEEEEMRRERMKEEVEMRRERMREEEQRRRDEEKRSKARSARRLLERKMELELLRAKNEGSRTAGSETASGENEMTSRFPGVSPHERMAAVNVAACAAKLPEYRAQCDRVRKLIEVESATDPPKSLEHLKKAEAVYTEASASPEESARTANITDRFSPEDETETTCQMAHEPLEQSGERYKRYYDRGAKSRALQVGDQVLLLLPTERNKLTKNWKGPYVVRGRKGEVDYVVEVDGNQKSFHVNMLTKYVSRAAGPDSRVPIIAAVASDLEDGARVWPLGEPADYRGVVRSESLTPPPARELRALISRYRKLTYFEPAPDRISKTLKRRIDMLEEILKEVNLRDYRWVCRQAMFELVEVYSELMSLNLAALPPAIKPQSLAVEKINSIIDKAIRHFRSFLEMAKYADGKYPEKRPEDLTRSVLVGHFSMGRLYYSNVAQRPREQFKIFEKAKEHYEFVQDCCRKVPEHERLMKEELEIMADVLKLIPNYATVVAPLTDLTKELAPNSVRRGDSEKQAFNRLKRLFSEAPILQVPDFNSPFVLPHEDDFAVMRIKGKVNVGADYLSRILPTMG